LYVKLKPGAHICNPNTLSQGDRKQRQPDPQKFTAQLDCKGIFFKKKKKKKILSQTSWKVRANNQGYPVTLHIHTSLI
jgi:hypothetical protein